MPEINDEESYFRARDVSRLLTTIQRTLLELHDTVIDIKRLTGVDELKEGKTELTANGFRNEEEETRYSMEHRDCCPRVGESRE